MHCSHVRFWPVALASILGISVGIALAEPKDPKADQPAKEPAAGAAETDVKADTAENLLKLIKDSERELRVVLREVQSAGGPDKLSAELKQKYTKEALRIAKAAELVGADPQASDKQIDEALSKKLTFLKVGVQIDMEKFAKLHEAAVADLVDKRPNHPAAAEAIAKRFEEKNLAGKVDKTSLDKLVGFAKEHPDNVYGLLLFKTLADKHVQAGDKSQAEAAFKQGIDLFASNRLVFLLKDGLKRLEIIGKPMEIKGPKVDGGEVDVASLKGKVVLIDFWATWCGPCVGELPNVKEVYKKYHDKGFEIIGVSLDGDKQALVDFVKENDMPWSQILFTDEEGKVQPNKLAQLHGIDAIPAMFLIGRDGNVAAAGMRGEELGKAVAAAIEVPVKAEKAAK